MSEQATQHIEFLAIPDLVERWHTTPSKLHRLIEDRYLGAIRVDGVLRIPAEFVVDDEPLQGLRGTLLALHDAGFSDEQAVWWLLNGNDELGERPVAALAAGRKSAVRRATQALAF